VSDHDSLGTLCRFRDRSRTYQAVPRSSHAVCNSRRKIRPCLAKWP
jgi:hypothetical protein